MRILYLAARFPWPPDRGDRLTGYRLIQTLARAHDVQLLSFRDGREPAGAVAAIEALGARVDAVMLPRWRSWAQAWAAFASPLPSQVAYYASARMARRTQELVRAFAPDVVFVQLVRLAPYGCALRHPCKVLFVGDSLAMALGRSAAFASRWRRPGVAWERWRMRRFEPRATRAFRESWLLSKVDRDALARSGGVNLQVVPHGVDERLFELPLSRPGAHRVLFLGNLSVPHNIDAARFLVRGIWPAIRARVPDARLTLAGADPVPAIRALERAPEIVVPGTVEDLLPVWRDSDVLIAPLRFSSGIQNKVLEAMAAGVPVVATPQVAEAMGARSDRELLAAATAEGLAECAIALLNDPARAADVARRARAFVRERFSWDTARLRLEALARGEA